MKNIIIKSVLALGMAFMVLPMMGQDWMNIYFKDGTQRKFYLRGVTEFSTSQYDASGVKHNDFDFQHVKTPDFNYVYDLAKIDSITFSKFDEDKTRRDFLSAMTSVLTAISDCESIEDAEKKLPQIKASEGVEDAWSDGHELFVKINKWETISFHFNHDADDATYENESSSFENMRKMIPQLRKVIKDGHQPKVVVANQQHFDDNRAYYIRDHYKPLLDEFAKCGFDTCYLQRPTLEFFARDIYEYDVVFLITHGNIYIGGHTFVTGENLGEILKNGDPSKEVLDEWSNVLNSLDFFKQYENRGSVYRTYNEEYRGEKIYWVGHPGLLESFFGTTQEGGVSEGFFPEGAIFFNTACRSMMNDEEKRVNWHSMADKFIDNHGLMLYLGYSESDSSGKKAGPEFFKSMLQGKSVGKAYQDLPPKYKKEESDEGAELKMWPEDCEGIFLVPTYTNEISSEKAQTNFNYNQTVEVEGYTTFNFSETTDGEGVIAYTNPANISMGFEYSTNEELLGPGRFTDKVEVTYLTKSIDKGNVKFRASLLDLEPNNTYYYRAYTSDGSFVNYGKPKSFSIYEKLSLSANSASLKVGEIATVDITSGSGSYSIENIEPTGVVTASISENHISIEAKTAETATITVKDDKSGQTVTIEVTVTGGTDPVSYLSCPDDNHPHIIDLELPSGTLWSCCNVGTTSPEGFGGLYAWGETEEKAKYDWKSYIYCDGTQETCHDLGESISGTKYDVAHVKWGKGWQMPSWNQFEELVDNCTFEWTEYNGTYCRKLISKKNGGIILLPAGGRILDAELLQRSSIGCYWTGTKFPSENYLAINFIYLSDKSDQFTGWRRSSGYSVRPVYVSTSPDPLSLSLSNVEMKAGETTTVDIISGNGSYTAQSSNTAVATATFSNNTIIVSGVSAGTATITVTDNESGQTATIVVTVTGSANPGVSPGEAIDLGLPSGTKWASCNVGATKPEEYGGYYAWGETEGKEIYNWSTYIHCDGSTSTCHDLGSDISGTEYDVAHVKWGGNWCVPTHNEQMELVNNCASEWTTLNGVKGQKFTGPNGNSIFIPAAGMRSESRLYDAGYDGNYWTSTHSPLNSYSAYDLIFDSGYVGWSIHYRGRFNGFTVRPVIRN